jgi:hypothetical protein
LCPGGARDMKRFIANTRLLRLHSHVKKHVEATSERYLSFLAACKLQSTISISIVETRFPAEHLSPHPVHPYLT